MEAVVGLGSPQFVPKSSLFSPKSRVPANLCPTLIPSKGFSSLSLARQGRGKHRRSSVAVKASLSSPQPSSPIAPLKLESPVGQFLSEILLKHPHLLPAAVDQQLEILQNARDSEEKEEAAAPASGTDLVLYRRIAEVKANERKKALEEILYSLIVQKFVEADVSLVPAITQPADPLERVDRWPPQDEKLERLHSPEAYEMIKNHLALILGQHLNDPNAVAPISKLRVGQVYAASVMYGYFLRRVDQRFQLEKSMKRLMGGSDEEDDTTKQGMLGEPGPNAKIEVSHPEVTSWPSSEFDQGGFSNMIKPSRLRAYVMSLDSETLQRYATIRSKEAFSIIEKHTEALFGRPHVVITKQGTIDSSNDELIKISFGGLKRLILEAVTFGSFLWDVESYVDFRYHFVSN